MPRHILSVTYAVDFARLFIPRLRLALHHTLQAVAESGFREEVPHDSSVWTAEQVNSPEVDEQTETCLSASKAF